MLKSERIAIARILADLVKADRIIDTGEMNCWEHLAEKYNLDSDTQVEAGSISFAMAVDTLRNSDDSELPGMLLDDCRKMTLSDGFCHASEALILTALTLLLDNSQPMPVDAISIERANFNVDVATALYVESEFDDTTNRAIRQNYRAIFREFQIAGFHFVYMPEIIDHYSKTDPALFRRILSFLAPAKSAEGIETAYRSLLKMTSAGFCNDLLCNKCGIESLRNTMPSLMIKIGTSFVGEKAYSNYLRIEVDDDILHTVCGLVDNYCSMLSSDQYIVQTSEERDNQFHFHGFYKQLLEIFLLRKNIRSTILLEPYREEIRFPDIDAEAAGIHRRERALYALLLCQGKDGVNLNPPKIDALKAKYTARMETLQKRYTALYELFGGNREQAPDLRIPEIRRPMISRLRKSLNNLPALYNPRDYNISKDADGIMRVAIDPALVFVSQLDSDTPVPLRDSVLYRRWLSAAP